jgi:pyruvate dehydrogenase complex dehydrogenase (E1) component
VKIHAAFAAAVAHTGRPTVVLSRGEVIVQDGKFLGKKGRGKFLKRGSPLLQT